MRLHGLSFVTVRWLESSPCLVYVWILLAGNTEHGFSIYSVILNYIVDMYLGSRRDVLNALSRVPKPV